MSVEPRYTGSYLDRFPLRASEMVQTGRGPMNLRSLETWGQSSFILDIQSRPRTSWSSLADPDWIGFTVPLWWEGDYLMNKAAAAPGNVFLLDSSSDFVFSYGKRRALLVGVRRPCFQRAWSSLRGTETEAFPNGHHLLPTSRFHADRLVRLITRVQNAASANGQNNGSYLIPPVFEADLISSIADWTVSLEGNAALRNLLEPSSLKIVEAALEQVRQSDLDQINIAALCGATGVGKTRLHQAFVDIHGVSPGEYLIKHRLSFSRELLNRSIDGARSVKDAALQAGFLSSGRFAQMYADSFGELPSTTFKRRARQEASWRYTVRPDHDVEEVG